MTRILRAGEVPTLFRKEEFTAADLAEAVNSFVVLGENEAVRQLIRLAPSRFEPGKEGLGLDFPDRVGWVLRILFLPKKTQALREPRYGSRGLPYLTMPLTRWPLYPVVTSGDSFFVLGGVSMLGGQAEDPKEYLKYCQREGRFRTQPVPAPTREQALKDVLALRQSDVWRTIKWKDSAPGRSYTMHEGTVWDYLKAQADSIPI